MRAGRTPLTYRSIAHLDDSEAQELAGRLGISPEPRRNKPRQENLLIRNGLIRRPESNEATFTTQETKIINDFAPQQLQEERLPKISKEDRSRDISKTAETYPVHTLKRSSSLLDEFLPDFSEDQHLKEDFCRIWYQKLALQGHAFVLQQENLRKDELINQLRIELEKKGAPHFGHNQPPQPLAAHNKSISHNPSFSGPAQGNPNQNQSPHWAPVHPNRNFTIGQPRNF